MARLFPGGVHGLGNEEGGVGAGSWAELLDAAAIDFGDVEVAFLIDAETVHAPEPAGKIAPDAEGIEKVAFEIVLEHFRSAAVESPERAVGADVDEVNVRRLLAGAPFIEVFAVFIEDLDAMIGAVVDEDVAGLRIGRDAVNVVHVAGALLVGRRSLLSPIHEEFAVFVEFRDASAVIAVGDEHCAIGEPGYIGGTVEMRAVGAFRLRRADGLHELFAIVGELVDGVHVVIYDPDVLLGIVGIDGDEMRALEDFVPLRPALDDVAVGVGNGDAVFPFGVHADGSVPAVGGRARIGARGPAARKRSGGRVAPGKAADGELDAGAELRKQFGLWAADVGQLATEEKEDAVGAFGVNSLPRAPRPFLVSGDGADVFGPVLHDFVGAESILTARLTGNRGETVAGLLLRLNDWSRVAEK